MKLNAAELQVPGGKLYQDGDTCKGKPAHVYVKQFAFAGDTTGTSAERRLRRNVLLQDQSLLTIAFVPASDKDTDPAAPGLRHHQPHKLAATSPTTTTVLGTTPTTATPSTTPTTAATDHSDNQVKK